MGKSRTGITTRQLTRLTLGLPPTETFPVGKSSVSTCGAFYIKENAICRREAGQETHVTMLDGVSRSRMRRSASASRLAGGTGGWKIEEGMKTAFRGIVSLSSEAEMPMILDGVSLTALPTDYSVESDYAWKALS